MWNSRFGSSWLLPSPQWRDTAATAKPFGKAGGASVKAELGKGRERCAVRGSGNRNGEKQQGTPGPERDGKVLSMAGHCRPWKSHARVKGYAQRNCVKPRPELTFLKNCSRWESRGRAEEKCKKERAAKRNCYMLTVRALNSPCAGRGERSLE